ncbi:ABC transporter permease [Pseudoroseicyclus aestuarii]|uniref:Peptide/nickel transport system permease protein n=1 Tax=Pseudoroseicyclus aestuarii TaxID=1795041 RepID=A0A318SSP5_9RHOB|nr:ABC transporter permease [Pseudoroseicyclus aestuarii]PYE80900.1 peptide/nickel transport system permease protein [Pseudoroseicyclus aestuarii]
MTALIARRPPLGALLAGLCLAALVLSALLGPLLSPYPYTQTDLMRTLAPPAWMDGGSWDHPLGTDQLGRDSLSRIFYSLRITLIIGFIGTAISAALGSLLGMIAGELRGWVDAGVMMMVDVQASLPFLVFALTALAIFGNGFWVLLAVIGINGWEGYARLARGMVLSLMHEDYVTAARAVGTRRWRLYRRYLLPGIRSAMIVQFTVTLAGTVLLESALSFLGLGIQPPVTSLGQMLGEGRDYLLFAPWIALAPGAVIVLLILSISLLGDWLRDLLDPFET